MAPSKRTAFIDLTGEPESKAARRDDRSLARSSSHLSGLSSFQSSQANPSTPPSSYGSSSQHPPRSSWVEDDFDEYPDQTQDNEDDPTASYELYGTMDNKIVGVRYYDGIVNPTERVLCRREPSNPYDRNAIRIDNVMRNQIGHLPAKLAVKLAPYMDRNDIVLEGVITGPKDTFDCPIRLIFYGPGESSRRLALEEKLKADKILKATQLKATRKDAEAQKKAAKNNKYGESSFGLASIGMQTQQGEQQQNSLQALLLDSEAVSFRGDLSSVDVLAMSEEALSQLPMAKQPEDIQLQLLPYQLQGLAWMIAKENPQLPEPGSKDVVQLWQRHEKGFLNLASNHISKNPKLAKGGVLADDMGLGKTLQVISLIMTSGFNEGPTLVVSPPAVMSNWEQQIQEHVKKDRMPRVLRYHGPTVNSKANLEEYDIVITTYDTLRSSQRKKGGGSPTSVHWRRVVLDEAHQIRNSKTVRAKAVHQLQADSRWMLTGTPIINSALDFLSVLKVLDIAGAQDDRWFTTNIYRPLLNGPPDSEDDKATDAGKVTNAGNATNAGKAARDKEARDTEKTDNSYEVAKKLFLMMIRELCLRRMKHMKFVNLKLPPKTEYIYRIKFTDKERHIYDALFSQTTAMLEQYQRSKDKRNRTTAADGCVPLEFASILVKILRLRQQCNHWSIGDKKIKEILKPLENANIVDFTPKNLEILQQALRAASDSGEDCAICYEPISMHSPVITACKHWFGRDCITKALKFKEVCPMCRRQITLKSLIDLPPVDDVDDDDGAFDKDTHSSKTEALESIVKAKLKDPKSKIIIFSQWTTFLDIVAKILDEAGLKHCGIRGDMTIRKRDEAISALNNDPDTRIMLASLAASGVGLNLAAADTVILADSWWAPAIEDQAVDRVHRLTQTRPVTVWKLVIEDTIEDKVLGVQAKKRELINMSLQDRWTQPKETNRLADVLEVLS